MTDAEAQPDSAPFESATHRDRMMIDLLVRLRDYGPMSDEQTLRQCLRLDELAALVPPPQRLQNAEQTLTSLAEYLQSPDKRDEFGDAIDHWKRSIEEARYHLNHADLPPAAMRNAQKRVTELTNMAALNHWIEHDPLEDTWNLTDSGKDAIDNLKIRLKM